MDREALRERFIQALTDAGGKRWERQAPDQTWLGGGHLPERP